MSPRTLDDHQRYEEVSAAVASLGADFTVVGSNLGAMLLITSVTMNDEHPPHATQTPAEPPGSFSGRVLAGVAAYVAVAILALPYAIPPLPRSIAAWVLLMIFAPPLYILGEWISEKMSGSWGESHPVAKFAKALLFVLFGLILIIINALCTTALRQ